MRSKVFVSYSHEDETWRKRVVDQLAVIERTGQFDVWDDRQLAPGEAWLPRLDEEMSSAKVALLLLSAPFLASRFVVEKQIPRLFQRHERDGMIIYPLLIRPCAWSDVPWVARMQLRPRDSKPVSSLRGARRDLVLAQTASEVAELVRGKAASSENSVQYTDNAPEVRPQPQAQERAVAPRPTMYAEFELEDGEPVRVKSSYKIWLGIKNVPDDTERVIYNLHDKSFKKPQRTVEWGPKDFMTSITSYGDVLISARGFGPSGEWRTRTSLKDALHERYGAADQYLIMTAIRDIENN